MCADINMVRPCLVADQPRQNELFVEVGRRSRMVAKPRLLSLRLTCRIPQNVEGHPQCEWTLWQIRCPPRHAGEYRCRALGRGAPCALPFHELNHMFLVLEILEFQLKLEVGGV